MMTTLSEIGTHVRTRREQKKLYKSKVADSSGVHRNTLSELEAGTGNVSLNTLTAVCDQLDLDIRLIPKDYAPAFSADGELDVAKLQELVARAVPNGAAEPTRPEGYWLVTSGKIRKGDLLWNLVTHVWDQASDTPGAKGDDIRAYAAVARPKNLKGTKQ